MEVTLHDFIDWRAQQTSFEDLAAFYDGTVNLAAEGTTPERYDGAFMTANAFDLIGAKPLLGRTVRINGQPTVIIGVMPEGFRFPVDKTSGCPSASTRRSSVDERGAKARRWRSTGA